MTYKEVNDLKVGDVVSLLRGKNKGEKGVVTAIWNFNDTSKGEIWLDVTFINSNLRCGTLGSIGNTMLSYKAFKKES